MGGLVVLVAWLILSSMCGVYASSKHRSWGAWFFLALIFSPLLAIIILLCLGDPTAAKDAGERKLMPDVEDPALYKKCKYCAEPVRIEAIKCKHCGSDISWS